LCFPIWRGLNTVRGLRGPWLASRAHAFPETDRHPQQVAELGLHKTDHAGSSYKASDSAYGGRCQAPRSSLHQCCTLSYFQKRMWFPFHSGATHGSSQPVCLVDHLPKPPYCLAEFFGHVRTKCSLRDIIGLLFVVCPSYDASATSISTTIIPYFLY